MRLAKLHDGHFPRPELTEMCQEHRSESILDLWNRRGISAASHEMGSENLSVVDTNDLAEQTTKLLEGGVHLSNWCTILRMLNDQRLVGPRKTNGMCCCAVDSSRRQRHLQKVWIVEAQWCWLVAAE